MLQQFSNFLDNYGIMENGCSESLNRTVVVERARCLLFNAKLDRKFWGEAVNTVVYLRNCSIDVELQNITPFELT